MGETVDRAAAVDVQTQTVRGSNVFQDGVVAGVIGAATVAIWFLVLDTIGGRPLFTPTTLGTALFRHGEGLAEPATLPIALDMVLMFTWVHGLAFAIVGGAVSWLVSVAEQRPSVGFGILLLFVVFEFGFVAAALAFAEPILHTLAWPAVLVANLLAAATMGGYFRLRHPHMRISP